MTSIERRGKRATQLLPSNAGVYGPQFGTFNDKHIVKIDRNVQEIRKGWMKDVVWVTSQLRVRSGQRGVCI